MEGLRNALKDLFYSILKSTLFFFDVLLVFVAYMDKNNF